MDAFSALGDSWIWVIAARSKMAQECLFTLISVQPN
jgi:hypothetical protein